MSDYLVLSVLPDNRVQMNLVKNVGDAIDRWRKSWSCPFLPVAVFPTHHDAFLKRVSLIQLPAQKTIEWAAARFSTMAIVQEWQFEVIHHIRKQGADISAALLMDWQRAVLA